VIKHQAADGRCEAGGEVVPRPSRWIGLAIRGGHLQLNLALELGHQLEGEIFQISRSQLGVVVADATQALARKLQPGGQLLALAPLL